MALGIRPYTRRTGDGVGEPLLDSENGEELMHVQPAVSIVLASCPPESPGTLYISTKQVIWLSDVDRNKGYSVDFLSLSLHAVSRDPEAYPSPCIYAQALSHSERLWLASRCLVRCVCVKTWDKIEHLMECQSIETGDDEDESDSSDSESTETLNLSKIKEMRLVPSDNDQLDTLFDIFCECAELNPEPCDEEGGGEGEGNNWAFSVDQMEDDAIEDSEWQASTNPTGGIGYSNGDHDLVQNVLELQIDDQRFEDAEEMEHETDTHHH